MTNPNTMKTLDRVFDIELTNRCNALCTFCPRDKTPKQGMMDFDTFKLALDRAAELDLCPDINSTGQGEPTLHPRIIEFAQYAQSKGLPYSITTNGSKLTEEMSNALLDAGLARINFSISDMHDDYEEIYALNFDNTLTNILGFLDANKKRGNPTQTMVNLVEHDLNRVKLPEYRKFWKKAGIDTFLNFTQNNRGGSCENGHYFIGSNRFTDEAKLALKKANVSALCGAPFKYLFVGWDGNYYICCNDYEKTSPMGHIKDFSVVEMDDIKKERLCSKEGIRACEQCSLDAVNKVREVMFEVENGEATSNDVDGVIAEISKITADFPSYMLVK